MSVCLSEAGDQISVEFVESPGIDSFLQSLNSNVIIVLYKKCGTTTSIVL
jgi:hypothetical protein